MIQDTLRFAAQQAEEGRAVALVTITETTGSSPAHPGQMMAVLADGSSEGTVGGGASEHQVIRRAVQAIKAGETVFTFGYDHGAEGMVCGGALAGTGTVVGAGLQLHIFGGGHVGQSLARVAVPTGFSTTVIEDRAALADAFENVRYVVCEPPAYPDTIPPASGGYTVICTRGHKTDLDALRFCLTRPYAYIGMIGSRKKVGALFEALRREKIPEERLAALYTPIGLDVASGAPAEIAISILAEILMIKNGGRPRHKRDVK